MEARAEPRGRPRYPRFVLADAVVDRLPTDGYVQAAVATWLLACLWPWPAGHPSWVTGILFPGILAATLIRALRTGADSDQDSFERRFWDDWEIAAVFFGLSVLAELPGLWIDDSLPSLLSRVLLFAGYSVLLLASEIQPHREGFWRSEQLERRLSLLTVGVLGVGLFGYFALTPALIHGRWQEAETPLAFLFTLLSALLSARFFSLALSAEDPKWRSIYRALAVAALCSTLFHGLRAGSGDPRPIQGILWASCLALMAVAVRLRRHPFAVDWTPTAPDHDAANDPVADSRLGVEFRTMLLALGVPLLHFVGYRSGLFSGDYEEVREIWMLFWAAALGGLAFAQQQIAGGRLRSILEEQQRIQKTLAAGERRMRMVSERKQADEALYYSREKYAKAFRTGLHALAVVSRRDGRHLETNEPYAALLHMDPEDLRDLRFTELQADESRRRAFDRALRREAQVRDFEMPVRDRQGHRRSFSVSAEPLEMDGEECFVMICDDLTLREERRLDSQRQRDLLAGCETAALVVNAAGELVYFNPAAARRFDGLDDSALRAPIAGRLFAKSPELTAAHLTTGEGRNWMGRLPGRAEGDSKPGFDCWWMPLEDRPKARGERLILCFDAG